MRHLLVGVVCLVAVLSGCTDSPSLLPAGAEIGFGDTDRPEEFSPASLYAYMDGGADIYLEYGVSRLAVRRYKQGTSGFVAELFEMKDEAAASGIYSFGRRVGSERELLPGCVAGMTDTEVLLARGRYYLVCRNEDPMAADPNTLEELARRLAGRLAGRCGLGDASAPVGATRPISGSEVFLAGPVGLNIRPWLADLSREGFRRGWLAEYQVNGGTVEGFSGEYSNSNTASTAGDALRSADVRVKCHGAKVAIVKTALASTDIDALLEQLL